MLFTWPASWSHDISSFYSSDISLFLINYTCCKLCNIWLLLFENNSRCYHYTGVSHWRKNIAAVITQDRVIDDNLKSQIKNRTLCTYRLFLLTRIFQYISNWSKVFEHLPTLFLLYIYRVITFPNFSKWWLQRRSNKINAILYDRYYLQNYKSIPFEKIASRTNYKKPNVPSHLHIFWLNLDKANHSFFHPFLLSEEIDFRKNAAWRNE